MLQLELFVLYAFAFVLPLFEAPKNLLWLVYAILWVANRLRNRSFGGPWSAWDTAILAWIVSGYGVAAFAGIHNSEWLSAFDILRYGSVLWMLKRSGYKPVVLSTLLLYITAGTLTALARGGYELWTIAGREYLGLNSVGHVNHSAIYVAIAFLAALSWLRGAWAQASASVRVLGLVVNTTFVVSLFIMTSRAAVGIAFLGAILLLAAHSVRSGKHLGMTLLAALFAAGIVFATKPEVIKRNEQLLKENIFLTHREGIWRVGLEAWKKFPLFGVGMGNFGRIDRPLVETWRLERGDPLIPERFRFSSHGHSLFVNALAERGAVGLAALLAVLVAWGLALGRSVPQANDPPIRWAYWGGAFGALLVAVIVGLVNTTLHHEHALISMLLLGGWLALRDQEPAQR